MASTRRKQRVQYTDKQRQEILAVADKNRLTAVQVLKKFGVIPVTYYSWRKKMGLARPKVRNGRTGPIAMAGSSNLTNSVRIVVRRRIIAIMPDIVRREVSNYLDALFVNTSRGRRSRR